MGDSICLACAANRALKSPILTPKQEIPSIESIATAIDSSEERSLKARESINTSIEARESINTNIEARESINTNHSCSITEGANPLSQSLNRKELLLINMSIFSERPDYFAQIAEDLVFKRYPKGHQIQEENQKVEKIAWVVDGNCSVSKTIPFNQLANGKLLKPAFGEILDAGVKRIYITLETQQLNAGDWFPMIPVNNRYHVQEMEHEKSKHGITADSDEVLIASIDTDVFLRLTSDRIITGLQTSISIVDYSIPYLQDEYLKSLSSKD